MNADVRFLRQVTHEFEEGFNHRDVDRIMRFYGETYVDVSLRHPVQTRAARRACYADVMRRGLQVQVQPTTLPTEVTSRSFAATERYMHLSPAAIEAAIRLLATTFAERPHGGGEILEPAGTEGPKAHIC